MAEMLANVMDAARPANAVLCLQIMDLGGQLAAVTLLVGRALYGQRFRDRLDKPPQAYASGS
jgi:hypothetical protein